MNQVFSLHFRHSASRNSPRFSFSGFSGWESDVLAADTIETDNSSAEREFVGIKQNVEAFIAVNSDTANHLSVSE